MRTLRIGVSGIHQEKIFPLGNAPSFISDDVSGFDGAVTDSSVGVNPHLCQLRHLDWRLCGEGCPPSTPSRTLTSPHRSVRAQCCSTSVYSILEAEIGECWERTKGDQGDGYKS